MTTASILGQLTMLLGCIADDFTRRDPTSPTCWVRGGNAHDPGPIACRRTPLEQEVDAVVGGAQVAHHSGARGGCAVADRARLVEAGRLPAVLFQVLLDLRLDP
jgi:hypothetical protein